MILRFSGLSGTNVMTPIRINGENAYKKDEQRVSLLLWCLDSHLGTHTVTIPFLSIYIIFRIAYFLLTSTP